MKILCVIRSSTARQETESQKREMIAFCKSKGFADEQMVFIEVAGASARKLNKAYIQMLEDIKLTIKEDPSIRNVALWHLNRLGRVESKLHEMKEFFVSNKIQVYCKNPDLTLLDEQGNESAGGGIAFSVFAAMVKSDTDEMFAKMKRGKDLKREQGIFVGGKIKFGYRIDSTKHFLIQEEEAAIIQTIFELYATSKYSIAKLVDELKARGITKRGSKMTYNIVKRILSDADYCTGRLPLITESLFNRCKAIRGNHVKVSRTKESKGVNFAIGILKCQCGKNYIGSGLFYECYSKLLSYRRRTERECFSPCIRKTIMDELLWLVTRILYQQDLIRKGQESIQEYLRMKEIILLKLSTCTHERTQIKRRIELFQDRYYIEGEMTEVQYQNRLSGLRSKEAQCDQQIGVLHAELHELAQKIRLISLSDKDRQTESLQLTDLNVETDRHKIKSLIFQYIEKATIHPYQMGTHRMNQITIISKTGVAFVFDYDIWLNTERKGECCLFYEHIPCYIEYPDHSINPMVTRKIREKAISG